MASQDYPISVILNSEHIRARSGTFFLFRGGR